jgi:hypothetical protein
MALTATTLAGAVVVDQNTITVASATGFAAGSLIRVDDEVMQVASNYSSGTSIGVLRGRDGTAGKAHASGANVVVGPPADFANPAPQTVARFLIAGRAREVRSYSAAGAIELPNPGNDALAIINGTTILAMTLAVPTKEMDGAVLTICGNGKAAHTVTVTSGLGNVGATADVLTFSATQAQAFSVIAANGFWNLLGAVVGAASVGGPGVG